MDLYIIILGVVAFMVILSGLLAWRRSPAQLGKEGEVFIHNVLSQLPQEYVVLDDVILKTPKGTAQIDHVVVSKYGLFAIETKNYRGEIYGNDNKDEWKQIIVTPVTYSSNRFKTYTYVTKNTLYNPVRQAKGHALALQQALKNWKYLRIIPIVVFTGKADLTHVITNHHVIDVDDLIPTILSYTTLYLSEENLPRVVQQITELNLRKVIKDKTHVNNVKEAKRAHLSKIYSGICPHCGGKLVLRKGKFGQFYGCSNYPKCKFTIE